MTAIRTNFLRERLTKCVHPNGAYDLRIDKHLTMVTSIDARDLMIEFPDMKMLFCYWRFGDHDHLLACFQRCAMKFPAISVSEAVD